MVSSTFLSHNIPLHEYIVLSTHPGYSLQFLGCELFFSTLLLSLLVVLFYSLKNILSINKIDNVHKSAIVLGWKYPLILVMIR